MRWSHIYLFLLMISTDIMGRLCAKLICCRNIPIKGHESPQGEKI